MFRARKQTKIVQTEPIVFPIGSFVHSEKGWFYIKSDNTRFRVPTKRCLESWAPHRVIEATESALVKYKIFTKLKFRNGSLLNSFATGSIYLIVEGKRCLITSPDTLAMLGAVRSDAVDVSLDELNLHPEGEPLK